MWGERFPSPEGCGGGAGEWKDAILKYLMYSFLLFPAASALCEGTRSFARTSPGRKSSVTRPEGREKEVTAWGEGWGDGGMERGAAQRYISTCKSMAMDYTRWDLEAVKVVATLMKQQWRRAKQWWRGNKFTYQLWSEAHLVGGSVTQNTFYFFFFLH